MKDDDVGIRFGYTTGMIWAIAFAVAALSCCTAWRYHEKSERYKACVEKFEQEQCEAGY